MTGAGELARATHHYVIAPAGCGKTRLIAGAVAQSPSSKRHLILTHTHAGVAALSGLLRKMGAHPRTFHLSTISGWVLGYVSSYPSTSGLPNPLPRSDEEWAEVYNAMARLLQFSWVRDIIGFSYSGIYVDEYQDCTVEQHGIVFALAQFLPCRVLGDPLQSIFEFRGTPLDWKRHVESSFERLGELDYPWRWSQTNPALGQWITQARSRLLASQPLDAADPSITWKRLPPDPQHTRMTILGTCKQAMSLKGKVVVMTKWENQCHSLASLLGGLYSCAETIECDQLIESSRDIGQSKGASRVMAVIKFAEACMTKTDLANIRRAFSLGKKITQRHRRYPQFLALAEVADANDQDLGRTTLAALQAIQGTEGVHVFRRELLAEMKHALREFGSGDHESLEAAAQCARNVTRIRGREMPGRVFGRTLIVKGLQFEHAIVICPEQMDVKNLYVAITRGSTSLTLLSESPIISPVGKSKSESKSNQLRLL